MHSIEQEGSNGTSYSHSVVLLLADNFLFLNIDEGFSQPHKHSGEQVASGMQLADHRAA